MVAGVSWQVFSLVLFGALCIDYALRVRKASNDQLNANPVFQQLRMSRKLKLLFLGLAVATITIFARSVFRCAELSGGFRGPLANQEITFMILEGAMICIAVICLTAFHPGWMFAGVWEEAAWSVRSGKMSVEEKMRSATFSDPALPRGFGV
jgi:hypothetical protein